MSTVWIILTTVLTFFSSIYGQRPCGEELADISVFPGDPLWGSSIEVNNPAFVDILPAFVARPKTVEDVQRCLACAYQGSVPFTVKSGGHSPIGMSTIDGSEDGAFIIYLADMKSVNIIDDFFVKVQAGARWEDVYAVVRSANKLVAGGICPSVGVAGYTLGGGISFISRKYGLAIDTLHDVTMVTVDGSEVVLANSKTNSDLFWALRGGGGGNFGVVVDFTFKLEPSSPAYAYGNMVIPRKNAVEALSYFGEEEFERELYLDVSIHPGGEVHMAYVNLGSPTESTMSKLNKFREFSSSFESDMYLNYWEIWDTHSHKMIYPRIEPHSITLRAAFLKHIHRDGARRLIDMTIPENCFHAFMHLGGAISDYDHSHTAFFHRNVNFELYSTCSYRNESEQRESMEFLKQLYVSFESEGELEGNYVNDPIMDLANWQYMYYGANYERLVEIQENWNPMNKGTYHFPQSIGSQHAYKLPIDKHQGRHTEL